MDDEVLERNDLPVLRRNDHGCVLFRELLGLQLVLLALQLDEGSDALSVFDEVLSAEANGSEPSQVPECRVLAVDDDSVKPVLKCREDDPLPVLTTGLE
jgi:hypothetical protein